MSIHNIQALILAAGKAKRFKTNTSKLLQKLCGQEMVLYITKALSELNIETAAIVGYQKEAVIDIIKQHHGESVTFISQEKQEGTGHAVLCSKHVWNKDLILILNGDMPLVTSKIIQQIYEKHRATNATITLAVAHDIDPSGAYGRIVQTGNKLAIVEAKEFTGDIEDHPFINAGIYLVQREFLETAITTLNRSTVSNEFYLTDIVKIASDADKIITPVIVPFDCVRGINNFKELWAAEQILRSELINHWMLEGVRFTLPHTNHLDNSVTIGSGSIIQSGVQLFGNTHIGNNCHIHSFSVLNNATLEDNVTVLPHTVIDNSIIKTDALVGPYAHIHSNTIIGEHATVGNFAETKKSTLGAHSKVKHLSYLGDASVGEHVNIGAGSITCNYDGKNKHTTTIENNVFIGSNNTLVAPITIHSGAYTAAGSVITEDVPANALAIARSRQTNKEEYARLLRDRMDKQNDLPKKQSTEL